MFFLPTPRVARTGLKPQSKRFGFTKKIRSPLRIKTLIEQIRSLPRVISKGKCLSLWRPNSIWQNPRKGVGILGGLSFHQYTPDDDLPAGLACIRAADDAIFGQIQDIKGLIIDVRSNGGGEDAFVLELASRLTDQRYLAFGKKALVRSTNAAFTTPESIFVETNRGPKYTGPAVLLVGRKSASAAETFTMALMGRKPRIIRVGENTQGVFSDVLDRRLPNGWRLVLPNEIYVMKTAKVST